MMNKILSLHWCDRCKESSVRIKCYEGKMDIKKRILFCINKGCGYSQEIIMPLEIINGRI